MINHTRRRAIVVAGVMLAGSALATTMRPTQLMSDTLGVPKLETMFPTSFGDWRVDTSLPVILPAPDVQAQLDKIYNEVIARTYVNKAGQRIMLSVAYGGDQSDATRAHRPEVCYPAQGFQIRSDRTAQLTVNARSIAARQLVAVQGGRIEPITYWVIVGNQVAVSGTDQKLRQLAYSTRGVIPDGMLVRISNISPDAAASYGMHQRFAEQLAGSLRAPERERIFGAGLAASAA